MDQTKTLDQLIAEYGVVLKDEDTRNLFVSKADYEIIINEIQMKEGLKVKIDANNFIVAKGKVISILYE